MPRLPRITAARLVRALKRMGFYEVRRRGSHMTFYHAERDVLITVSVHPRKILRLKTLQSILKQGGISVEELEDNL